MTSMLSKSDPYAQWLGIKLTVRPLNAYQLLGLPTYDGDSSRVRAAVKRRRDQLSFHRETEPAVWRSVHDELEEAARTLTDAEARAVYDAGLRRQSGLAEAMAAIKLDESSTLTCAGCQTESPGNRRFCAGCGESLWEICSSCQAPGPAHEKFCGGCGANRGEALQAARRQVLEHLATAESLIQNHQWPQALQVAHRAACLADPQLDELGRRAAESWRNWRASYQAIRERVTQAEQEALASQQRGDLAHALQVVARVPEPLRTPALAQIEDRARSERRNLQRLETELRSSVAAKRVDALGPIVDELLRLDPGHAQAQKIGGQLARLFCTAAQKRMAAGEFEPAVAALSRIPQVARDEHYARLVAELGERQWLVNFVRNAVEVDRCLVQVVERLVKLAPQVAQFQAWQQQLAALAGTRGAQVPWNNALPPQAVVGPAVRHWPAPRRLKFATAAEDIGQLGTALGLALQGLQEAALNTNLVDERRGLLPGFGLSRKPPDVAWGIDLGAAALKAVRLRRRSDGAIEVDQALQVPTYSAGHQATTEATTALLAQALPKFLAQLPLSKGERICVTSPAVHVLTKVIGLPRAKTKRLRDVLQFEARRALPLALEELVWDHDLITPAEDDVEAAGDLEQKAVLVAAKNTIVEGFLAAWQAAGGPQIDVLQDGVLALSNFARYELNLDGARGPAAIGLLDLGASRSTYLVASRGNIWSRSLPVSGKLLTERIVRECQLTWEQGELVKREPWRAAKIHQVYQALEPSLHDLLHDVRRSLTVLGREDPQLSDHVLYLVGGGARLHGLLTYLTALGLEAPATTKIGVAPCLA